MTGVDAVRAAPTILSMFSPPACGRFVQPSRVRDLGGIASGHQSSRFRTFEAYFFRRSKFCQPDPSIKTRGFIRSSSNEDRWNTCAIESLARQNSILGEPTISNIFQFDLDRLQCSLRKRRNLTLVEFTLRQPHVALPALREPPLKRADRHTEQFVLRRGRWRLVTDRHGHAPIAFLSALDICFETLMGQQKMLTKLRVENFRSIETCDVEFGPGRDALRCWQHDIVRISRCRLSR